MINDKYKMDIVKEFPGEETLIMDWIPKLFAQILKKKGKIIRIDFKNDRDKECFKSKLYNERRAGRFPYSFARNELQIYIDMRRKII